MQNWVKIVKIAYFLKYKFDIVAGSCRWSTRSPDLPQKLTIVSKKHTPPPLFAKNGGGGGQKVNVVWRKFGLRTVWKITKTQEMCPLFFHLSSFCHFFLCVHFCQLSWFCLLFVLILFIFLLCVCHIIVQNGCQKLPQRPTGIFFFMQEQFVFLETVHIYIA